MEQNVTNLNRPLIFICNDDGVKGAGLQRLMQLMRKFGDVVVVAPDCGRSAASCAVSAGQLVSYQLEKEEEGLQVYACSGTPVDCVKLGMNRLLPRKPDLMVSGINRGANLSVSVHYSGTVAATIEGCVQGVPSIAFSLCCKNVVPDFAVCDDVVSRVTRRVLADGLPTDVLLNVNIPAVDYLVTETKVCRLSRGIWIKEWNDTADANTLHMDGEYHNLEPEATDTDCWAIANGIASITPLTLDTTVHHLLDKQYT